MTEAEKRLLSGETCGPHCDPKVLHQPGECQVCDEFPMLQAARKLWGINFTGSTEDGLLCPSEIARDIEIINRWPNNRPLKGDEEVGL